VIKEMCTLFVIRKQLPSYLVGSQSVDIALLGFIPVAYMLKNKHTIEAFLMNDQIFI